MKQRATKRYNGPTEKTFPENVENSKLPITKGKGYVVNRYLLRLQMLKRGVETWNDLARKAGVNAKNFRALVAGVSWRPGMARRIERFLGVEEGAIFRRMAPTPALPHKRGRGKMETLPRKAGEGRKGKTSRKQEGKEKRK